MSSQATISVEEYLGTSYQDGDREYIEGRVVERNVGEKSHSKAQGLTLYFFLSRRDVLNAFAFPEQRVQVKSDRYRVPDVCVYLNAEPDEEIFTTPPFLVIEILSKDDRASDIQEKIDDYLAFGIPFVWVIDPRRKRGWVHTPQGSHEANDGVLRTHNTEIAMPLALIGM